MAETYSQSITGADVSNEFAPKVLTIGDSVAGTQARGQAMRLGTQFLVKGPDGSQAWYTYDAERNIPGVLNYLVKVT